MSKRGGYKHLGKTKTISFKIEEIHYLRLKEIAKEKGWCVSELLRRIINKLIGREVLE